MAKGRGAAVKKLVRILVKTVKWGFIVFCVFLGSLFFRDQRIPSEWVVSAVSSRIPDSIVFKCDSASFGFRHGARVVGVRLYDRGMNEPLKPVVSIDTLSVDFILRRVRMVALKVPRLHDGYYEPGNVERNARIDVELPRVPPFTLELVRPEILGVAPDRVRASVKTRRRRVDVTDFSLVWPDIDRRMVLDGRCCVDFESQRLYGEVSGEARQAHIRPMIVALDLPVALPYMDAFTGVTEPVRASCAWDVDLVNSDLKLHLDLHPLLGRYNGVPMRQVDGEIGVYAYTRGTNLNYVTTIGPLVARDPRGRALEGKLSIRGTNDVVTLDFDAKSTLEKGNLLSIIDYLNDGTLDCVRCDTPPEVTVSGTLAPDPSRIEENDMRGTIAIRKGLLFGMHLDDVSLGYSCKGSSVFFDDIRAKGRDGGQYTGRAALRFVPGDMEASTFYVESDCRDGSLDELAEALDTNFGGRRGVVNAHSEVIGPLSTNLYPRLNGRGRIRVTDECLSQMKLFMGLTDYLASNVPGVAGLVNQSQASADYTITNGVIASDNIYIEGDVFTIKAWGKYDIPADALDFTVRLQLLRNDSLLSKLVRPVTFPFTKLLLEFKVTGSVEEPKWEYISVLDRIL